MRDGAWASFYVVFWCSSQRRLHFYHQCCRRSQNGFPLLGGVRWRAAPSGDAPIRRGDAWRVSTPPVALLQLVYSSSPATSHGYGAPYEGRSAVAVSDSDPPLGRWGCLRLWRSCICGILPPLSTESLRLAALMNRLPSLVDLGDELIRPAMLLLDWHILLDATHACVVALSSHLTRQFSCQS